MKLKPTRSLRHWTLRYVKDKAALAFYQWKFRDSPWLTREAVKILSDWLKAGDEGIEWGSGRSTLWLAKKVTRLISIESNKQWHEHVKQSLADNEVKNVELSYAPLATGNPASQNQEYVDIGARLPEQSLDFALVDGKLRDQCVECAMRLLKPGGLLIIDNAERYIPCVSHSPDAIGINDAPPTELWKQLIQRLEYWRSIWTSNGLFDSALFVRGTSRNS